MSDIGNQIYQRIGVAKNEVFLQGELAQLTYLSYEETAKRIQDEDSEEIELSYPVGYRPDKSVIPNTTKYSKDDLIKRYAYLGNHQLAINGIYQLVTIMETVLGDLLRIVIKKFPNKIGSKRSIKSSVILTASTIEEIHIKTIDSVLNEIAYKSPKEFASEIQQFMSINLLECPAYHKYMEIKATRDIYIHNKGNANEMYLSKAGSHARVKAEEVLPIDSIYFLESFEACLQITEWLENSLHNVWHSSEFETYQKSRKNA